MSQQILSNLDFSGVARGVNHLDPVNAQDIATKAYVDGNVAEGTAFGRALGAGTGARGTLTGAQLAAMLRLGTTQSAAGALPLNITLNADTTYLSIDTAGDGEIQTISGATKGRVVLVQIFNFGTKTIKHSGGTNGLICPGLVDFKCSVRDSFLIVGDAGGGPLWQIVSAPLGLGRVGMAQLAAIAAGRAIGLQIDAGGSLTPVPLTGAELGEMSRFEFVQTNAISAPGTPIAPGTYDNFEVDYRASALVIGITSPGDVILNGLQFVSAPGVPVSNAGGLLRIQKEGTVGRLVLAHAAAASTATNQFWTPRQLSYELSYNFDGVVVMNQGARWRFGNRALQPGAITPTELAPYSAALGGAAVTFPVTLTPGVPGTPDDVTFVAPFGYEIIGFAGRCTTAIAGATLQGRDAAGGAGAALTDTLSFAATGPAAVTAGLASIATVATGATLYLRRSDRGVGGKVYIHVVRT